MMKQMTRSPLFSYVIVAGLACVMGLSYELFVFPNSFAPAGINGLTTMIQYLFHINIGYLSLLINLPLILLGLDQAGPGFCPQESGIRTGVFRCDSGTGTDGPERHCL